MRSNGFTLIEVLAASALLMLVGGVILQTWLNAGETAEVLDKKSAGTIDSLRLLTALGQELRQASRSSLSALPANQLNYRIAWDVDGNGFAVDAGGSAELSELRTITRDYEDRNGDGLREDQLVLITDEDVRVLANHLTPVKDESHDAGVWFEPHNEGIRITIHTTGRTRRGVQTPSVHRQWLRPRNP